MSQKHFNGFIHNCIWLNCFLTTMFLLWLCVCYKNFIKKEHSDYLNKADKITNEINKDIAFLDAVITVNANKKLVLIPPHWKASLKIYKTAQIIIDQDILTIEQTSSPNTSSLWMLNSSEFIIRKVFVSKGKVIKLDGRFYVENLTENLSQNVGTKCILAKHPSSSKHVLTAFNGSNFTIIIDAYKPNVYDFIIKNSSTLLFFSSSLFIFNAFFITLFLKALNNIKKYTPLEIARLKKALQDQESQNKEKVDEIQKQDSYQKSLRRSLAALEVVIIELFESFKNQTNSIYAFLQATEMNSESPSFNQLQLVFNRFDLNHIVDPFNIENVDCAEIINKAIELNASSLQEKEIFLLRKGLNKDMIINCNKAVFSRILSSLLYRAILASTKKANITVSISEHKSHIVIQIEDSGYRASYDTETSNPFKLTLDQIMEGLEKYSMKLSIEHLQPSGSRYNLHCFKRKFTEESSNIVYFSDMLRDATRSSEK